MGHIGKIIKEFRCTLGISRKDLSDNVCTEKYIYLIEKGERTPSSDILSMLSDKLGVDLFGYYQFLNCINPVKTYEITQKFSIYQRLSDFDMVMEIAEEAAKMPDFKVKPRSYELETNRIAYKVFSQQKYEEAVSDLRCLFQKIEPEYLNDIFVVNTYILLSTCYQLMGNLAGAKDATFKAYDIVRTKYNDQKHSQIIITVRINLITLCYLSGECDKVILEGEALLQYQQEINSRARIHYTYAYLAFSYYKLKAYDKAFSYFRRTIYALMLITVL